MKTKAKKILFPIISFVLGLLLIFFYQINLPEYVGTRDNLHVRIFDNFIVIPNRYWLDTRFQNSNGECSTYRAFLDSEEDVIGAIQFCSSWPDPLDEDVISERFGKLGYKTVKNYDYQNYSVFEYTSDDSQLRNMLISKEPYYMILTGVPNDMLWKEMLDSVHQDVTL